MHNALHRLSIAESQGPCWHQVSDIVNHLYSLLDNIDDVARCDAVCRAWASADISTFLELGPIHHEWLKRNAGRLQAFAYRAYREGYWPDYVYPEPQQLPSGDLLVILAAASKARSIHITSSTLQQAPSWLGSRLHNLEQLSLEASSLQRLPNTLFHSRLQVLDLHQCDHLKGLPDSLGYLASGLKQLCIDKCGLEQLPSTFGKLPQLEILVLSLLTSLESLPDSFGQLQQLNTLHIIGCRALTKPPDNLHKLNSLRVLDLRCCSITNIPEQPGGLVPAAVSTQGPIPQQIGSPPVHPSDSNTWLPALQRLSITNCDDLWLPNSIGSCSGLVDFYMTGILVQEIPDSLCNCRQLTSLNLGFSDPSFATLPAQLGQLSSLRQLRVGRHANLQHLPDSLGQLLELTELVIHRCTELRCLPGSITRLSNLRMLSLWDLGIHQMPRKIGYLHHLEDLEISDCPNLVHIPPALGRLGQLQRLCVRNCPVLNSMPSHSWSGLVRLRDLEITGCPKLRNDLAGLDHLGQLKCLQFDRHSLALVPQQFLEDYNQGGDHMELDSDHSSSTSNSDREADVDADTAGSNTKRRRLQIDVDLGPLEGLHRSGVLQFGVQAAPAVDLDSEAAAYVFPDSSDGSSCS